MQKQIAWNTGSGNITLTYLGEGNDTVAVSSDENGGAAREQTIAIQTTNGAVAKNVTVKQAACPVLVGAVKNFAYTGAVQSIELPKGKYKLQCWGAQGGSNAAASAYGITAQAGGKGGYSEGVVTLTQKTTLYIFVGGQGSSSGNGGWNGGGGGSGSSSYNSSGTNGVSRMAGGGGATDIALVTSGMSYSSYRTNRSSASLLSRIIVAGGGSGGAMGYKAVDSSVKKYESIISGFSYTDYYSGSSYTLYMYAKNNVTNANMAGKKVRILINGSSSYPFKTVSLRYGNLYGSYSVSSPQYTLTKSGSTYYADVTLPTTFNKNDIDEILISLEYASGSYYSWVASSVTSIAIQEEKTTTEIIKSNLSQVGYAGGGSNGQGYSSSYYGRQNGAGSNGAFGLGANMTRTSSRYCSAAGGGGWYGGGSAYSDSSDSYVKYSGGGSGFVNIASNASYRPSGYTGLQLDSGTTTAGNASFESTSGGKETGHSGNGYARITRIE